MCFREVLNLSFYIGKKVQKKFLMGLKFWCEVGGQKKKSKSQQVERLLDLRPKI